ncbi:hypothetical protein [Butyrivibrio sp. YAB3001]|uniref:hypothetical protein n=1 Tax=Butyrivibrio sp. YAB3001 TaxID=1520812 RepID=UPI0008F628E4|nr:hypothetical protein [Butyrivibrio sp. YAB3001]SFB71756.1 hypothetical protein SAMN02910398_00411 [Butyrivibrio sp. YAB3001]
MSKDYEYFSDEELNKLIESVEADAMAKAPENLEADILSYIDEKEKLQNKQPGNMKIVPLVRTANSGVVEYSLYCAKVFGAIAAAILILTISPFIKWDNAVPDREEVLSHTEIRSREEVLQERENRELLPKIESIVEMIRENIL